MVSRYPNDDQLVDVVNQASTALIRLDEHGGIVANPAAYLLFGSHDKIRATARDLSTKLSAHTESQNDVVDTDSSTFPVALVNVARHDDTEGARFYLAARPRLSSALPASSTDRPSTGALPAAQVWIDVVATAAGAALTDLELLRELFDRSPVAIHVIAANGVVVAANGRDIDLVGASADVDGYVGGHIRRAYADQDVVDDFLSRWDSDGPIIGFRADFLNTATDNPQRMPVEIFSTARAADNTLMNTRCFVFGDENPSWERDQALENQGS